MKKSQHIVRYKERRAIKKSGRLKATKIFESQKYPIEKGILIAKNQLAVLVFIMRRKKQEKRILMEMISLRHENKENFNG